MQPAPRPTPPALPAHATRRLFTVYIVIGGVLAFLGAMLCALNLLLTSGVALAALGALYLALGALAASYGVYGRAVGAGVQVLNSSLNLIGLGRLAEAEGLLEQVERGSSLGILRRVADLQRAMIAMRRGDLAAALTRSTAAVERPLPLLGRAHARVQIAHARAIRAMLRASTGDAEGSRADAAAVRASPEAMPQALARATLAEGLVLDHAGRRADLGALLAENRRLLLEATEPRERALVRAWQRMLKARSTTVYREPSRAAPTEEPPLTDWLSRLSPSAAAHAPPAPARPAAVEGAAPPTRPSGGATPEREEAGEHVLSVGRQAAPAAAARARSAPRRTRALLLWVALIGVFAGFYSAVGGQSDGDGGGTSVTPFSIMEMLVPALLVVLALVIAMRVRQIARGSRETRRLQAALADLARGAQERGERALEELSLSRLDLIAAQAELHLAVARERAADVRGALARCDRGIGRLARYGARLAAADLLLPQLAAERAFLLCALDRPGEAHAELTTLPPAYAFLARDRLRVRLLERCRAGDLRGAAALAEGRALDLPLGPYDELLADAARAAANPEAAGAGEVARLKEELRAFAEGRRWVEAVAPAVLRALEATPENEDEGEAARGAEEAAAAARGAELEAEAQAEAEAEAGPPRARPIERSGRAGRA